MVKGPRKRKVFASDAGSAAGRQAKNSRSSAAHVPICTATSAGPSERAIWAANPKARSINGRKSQAAKDIAKAKRQAKAQATKAAATAILIAAPPAADQIVVGSSPAFPIFDAPVTQIPTFQPPTPANPPSPSPSVAATATVVSTSPPHEAAILLPQNPRTLVRQGAVVLDSDIHPSLRNSTPSVLPNPSIVDIQTASAAPASDCASTISAATGSSARTSGAGKINSRSLANTEEEVKDKEVVKQPKDWADPYATLAYVKKRRVKIKNLTKRTNQFKKTFFKMRRDAMALEIQTGAFVSLFVCKAHKNRDDNQHAYNFHFSDTMIHNLVLVELAKNLKQDVKAHMAAIWATGVGKGESVLIIQQRAQLAEAREVAGTLRAQAEVAKQRSKGQTKEIMRQEKAMQKQKDKVAEMKA